MFDQSKFGRYDRQEGPGHTFHGVAGLPLKLCRVATELVVRAEDEGNVS